MLSLDAIENARRRIAPYLPPTPLERSRALEKVSGHPVWLKLELFQPVRVFKIRGALNALLRLKEKGVIGSVVTSSAGNHGLAVAWAARRLGLEAVIFVPEKASSAKVQAIRDLGGDVRAMGRDFKEAFDAASTFAAKMRLPFVHAFDDPDVMAGQGTLALELLEQSANLTEVVVPIGGGGLISGVGTVLKKRRPDLKLVGVAMEGADGVIRSLEQGHPVHLSRVDTLADGLALPGPSPATFEHIQQFVDEFVVLEDTDLVTAMDFLLRRERLLVEPSGAAAVAALLTMPEAFSGSTAAVITGGNLSVDLLVPLVQGDLAPR